jgi:hypothetical protein
VPWRTYSKPCLSARPGEEGQDRQFTVQGLDGGLLVDTEHCCMGWGIEIETDDVGSLLFELGIGTRAVSFDGTQMLSSFFTTVIRRIRPRSGGRYGAGAWIHHLVPSLAPAHTMPTS